MFALCSVKVVGRSLAPVHTLVAPFVQLEIGSLAPFHTLRHSSSWKSELATAHDTRDYFYATSPLSWVLVLALFLFLFNPWLNNLQTRTWKAAVLRCQPYLQSISGAK